MFLFWTMGVAFCLCLIGMGYLEGITGRKRAKAIYDAQIVTQDGEVCSIVSNETTVGSAISCDVVVSKEFGPPCIVVFRDDKYFLRKLAGSCMISIVRGNRSQPMLDNEVELVNGDNVWAGGLHAFSFRRGW